MKPITVTTARRPLCWLLAALAWRPASSAGVRAYDPQTGSIHSGVLATFFLVQN